MTLPDINTYVYNVVVYMNLNLNIFIGKGFKINCNRELMSVNYKHYNIN